jgi:hypothetical protein
MSSSSSSFLDRNEKSLDPSFDDWPLLRLRTSPLTGRSLSAAKAIPAHTLVQVVSRPFASVILKPFRKEVCAWCFAYDRGRRWKVSHTESGFRFCQEGCKEAWEEEMGEVGLEALETLASARFGEAGGSSKTGGGSGKDRRDGDGVVSTASARVADIEQAWEESRQVAQDLYAIRTWSTKPTKGQARAIRKAREAVTVDDEDDAHFLLSGIISAARSREDWSEFKTLTPSYDTYLSSPETLESHIRIYYFFLATLPVSLLDYVVPEVLLSVVTRDCHNSFSVRDNDTMTSSSSSADDDYTTTEFLGYGTWSLASFYNHSCEPNVRKQRKGRAMTFWTARDVEEGEELAISYLGGEVNLKEDGVEKRAEKLETGWGFVCRCARCERDRSRKGGGGEERGGLEICNGETLQPCL